jgi:hypothetical protein
MTMENSGHEETNSAADKGQPPVAAAVPNPSRRRFNRAGVGASAVVMTLASRSVLANAACTTASGFTSLNQSSRGGTPPVCNGVTPEVWLSKPADSWPISKDLKFVGIFGSVSNTLEVGKPLKIYGKDDGNGAPGLKLADATLQQALFGTNTKPVVKYIIAALLNSVTLNQFPTRESVIKIFQEWNSKTTYEPTAGVSWNDDKIIEYLRATQIPSAS